MSTETEEKLRKRIKELKESLEKERKAHEKTKKEFEEFRAKHSITVENLRKAMNIKPNSKKKLKPVGAPKGHKAYTRWYENS